MSGAILGPILGHPEPNYGYQGLHFEIRLWLSQQKMASRAHAGLFLALFERFLSTGDHTKYIGKNGSDCMLFFTWVIKLMKVIGKKVLPCTCLILGQIHALSRPQQAGYAASSSLTWPVLDVSWPVWPCLGVSLGPTCGQSE